MTIPTSNGYPIPTHGNTLDGFTMKGASGV